MNEKYDEPCACREIMTKERLYEWLDDSIRRSGLLIAKEEAKLETLAAIKRKLDEYFEDLDKAEK